ncbi:MAG: hypothetical protein ABEJ03_00370 [Candidatus Nanohaloarchaea archaeon]
MDLLGKQAKEARENVEKVSEEVQKLESHLDAVDSALQDHMQTSESILADEVQVDRSLEEKVQELDSGLTDAESKIGEMQEMVSRLKTRQEQNTELLEQIASSDMLETIERVRKLVDSANKRYYDLQKSIREVEDRLNELENDFVMEVNSREFDFERKVDRQDFEAETDELRSEINKLRTSVSILAEEEGRNDLS